MCTVRKIVLLSVAVWLVFLSRAQAAPPYRLVLPVAHRSSLVDYRESDVLFMPDRAYPYFVIVQSWRFPTQEERAFSHQWVSPQGVVYDTRDDVYLYHGWTTTSSSLRQVPYPPAGHWLLATLVDGRPVASAEFVYDGHVLAGPVKSPNSRTLYERRLSYAGL